MRPLVFKARRASLGETPSRYSPSPAEIKKEKPVYNSFYRADKSRYLTVAQIAEAARKAANDPQPFTQKTVRAIAESSWNFHVKYARTGYENYGYDGPQLNKFYSLDPRATVKTGNEYPVLWIPDPNNPKEPEEVLGIKPPVVVKPPIQPPVVVKPPVVYPPIQQSSKSTGLMPLVILTALGKVFSEW